MVDKKVVWNGVKSQAFQFSNNKRTASRTGFYKTLALDAWKLKMVTNDDVHITTNKSSTDDNLEDNLVNPTSQY